MHTNSCAHHISVIFHLITRRLYLASQEFGGPGFTPRQVQLLHYIIAHSAEGDVFQRDLEAAFTIRRPTASGILRLMEENGLIRRESVPHDARLKKLIATDKALTLIRQADQAMADAEADLIRGISQEDLAHFDRILLQMEQNLQKTQKSAKK